MSVRNCAFPWHWLIIAADGNVMPCSHGSLPVGNLKDNTLEEIWNGPAIQDVRRSILANEVHPLCKCQGCPFQREDPSYPEKPFPLEIDEEFAAHFDEQWYLEHHEDVGRAVGNGAFSSGLEHFVRHGRAEGRQHQVRTDPMPSLPGSDEASRPSPHLMPDNAAMGLVEYSNGKLVLKSYPSDLIIVVTNFCNLRCVMCPQGMREVHNPEHTPVEFVAKAAHFLLRAQRVILSGIGEPLLAPAFWEVVERLRDKPFGLLRIHSNGHFISPKNAERLLQSGLNLLLVSLDAATPETYFQIRGSDFEKPLTGIRTIIEARKMHPASKLRIGLTMILMKDNVSEARAFIRLANELEVDSAIFSQIFTFGDRPDWVIHRKTGDFVYSDQMLSKIKPLVSVHLKEAMEEAESLGVKVVFHDNVESYL